MKTFKTRTFYRVLTMISTLAVFFCTQKPLYGQDCTSCATATCASAAITDQINVFNNVDGYGGDDQECHPTITASVSDGDTTTFCSTFTTPAVLEEDFMSFLGSIPTADAGCDATTIGNWQLTSNCVPVTAASFTTNEPNLPANSPRPVWPITPNTTYELCYDVTVTGSTCSEISNPCFAPHWVTVPCELVVGNASQDCSANDGTYDISIMFSNGGQGVGTYAITTNIGTIGGDDPNTVSSGVILVNDIPDGSGYDIEINGDGVTSGCEFNITSPGYTCSFCPTINSATVAQDECGTDTVTLTATVSSGVEGEDYYIQWLRNGVPIADDAASTVGQDGIFGTSDDPATALTYQHTLAFDGSVGSCSFQDQIFTAQLYCKTSDELNQGNSALGGTSPGGGVTVIANYTALGETCTNLDLSGLPPEAIAESFDYQFRVTSGPPFGNSWICEAVVSVKSPVAATGPFCNDFWAGNCPALGSGDTCFGGPTGSGTMLIPTTIANDNLGGINSTTQAQGLWQICVYDSFNDTNSTEGVLNYAYLKVNYFLPPGAGVNFPNGSIVDAVNVSLPAPAASGPLTTSSNPNGENLVTALRVCNAPAEGVDFTLPDAANCGSTITTICSEAEVRYSNDGGATYLLTTAPGVAVNGQTIYYEVTTPDCAAFCGTQGSYTLAGCSDTDGDGISDNIEISNGSDESDPCDPAQAAGYTGYDSLNTIWLEADCDGDGVTNGEEATNGTDPYLNTDTDGDGIPDDLEIDNGSDEADPCDPAQAAGYTGYESLNPTWTAADCDGDGVTNGNELTDSTDPYAPCDFLDSSISLEQSGDYLIADCDDDGIPNGQELTDGTDLFDACSSLSGSNPVGIICDIEITNELMTPDGDGINDVFRIRYIESYPNNTVKIFNRWGVIVFETTAYDNNSNAFAGLSDGRATVQKGDGLPPGVYFYIINYNDNGVTKSKSGYLYLNQ